MLHYQVFPTACYHTAEACYPAEVCYRIAVACSLAAVLRSVEEACSLVAVLRSAEEACSPVAVLYSVVVVCCPAVVCAGMTVSVPAGSEQVVFYCPAGCRVYMQNCSDCYFLFCTVTGRNQSELLQKASSPMMQMP